MGNTAAIKRFDASLAEVNEAVTDFQTKEGSETESRQQKNAALYAALEKAYQFHDRWHSTPEYAAHLKQKEIKPTPKKGASEFTPTVKLFFHPGLDTLNPPKLDEAGRKDKARKQKAVSSYCSALEWAVIKGKTSGIAAFLEKQGDDGRSGVDAASAGLAVHRKQSETEKQRRDRLKDAERLRIESLLNLRKERKCLDMPEWVGRAGDVVVASFEIGNDGKPWFLEYLHEPSATAIYHRYLLEVQPDTAINKLVEVLSFAEPLTGQGYMAKLVNADDGCELFVSSAYEEDCLGHRRLFRQDYLPNGTYWFGEEVVAAFKKLAVLTRYGADFVFLHQDEQEGKRVVLPIRIQRTKEAITAYNRQHEPKKWMWSEALGKVDGTFTHEADETALSLTTFMDKVSVASELSPDAASITLSAPMRKWLSETLSKPEDVIADERLKLAIYGDRTARIRLTEQTLSLRDERGDVVKFPLNPSISPADGRWDISVNPQQLLNAISALSEVAPGTDIRMTCIDDRLTLRAVSAEYQFPMIPRRIGNDD